MAISNLLLNEGSGATGGFKGDFDVPTRATDNRSRVSKIRYIDSTAVNLSTDDYKIMRIAKGQTVINSTIIVVTPEGAADAMDVGYYQDDTTASATCFETDQNMNAVGVFKGCIQGTDAMYQFLDNGWITITPAASHTASKFYVEVELIDTPAAADEPGMLIDYDVSD